MRFVRLCLLLCGLLFMTAELYAKPKKLTAAEQQFNVYITQATESFKLQDFKKALEAYQEAYKIDPVPAIQLAMGQCYRALEDYNAAKRSYGQYLRDSPNAADKKAVEETIIELERLIALGALEFESDPIGAQLFIDNVPRGVTKEGAPLEVTGLEPGEHTIKVTKDGYKTFERKFKLSPGQRQLLGASLDALPGTIEIKTEQEGVEVALNGGEKQLIKGGTLTLSDLKAGEPHLLQFTKQNFQSRQDKITLMPGQHLILAPVLEPGFGIVKIQINLKGADVSIGSSHKAKTNDSGFLMFERVPAGTQEIKISLPPFQDSTQTIIVEDGKEVPYEAVFTNPPLPKLLYGVSAASLVTSGVLFIAVSAVGNPGSNIADGTLLPGEILGFSFLGTWLVSGGAGTAIFLSQRVKKISDSRKMKQEKKKEKEQEREKERAEKKKE